MNAKIVNHKKDDAVSPVVGVMLMLVVTIVIAAVVALFATSVVTDTEAAPVAVIQMDAYNGEPSVNDKLVMSMIGGKALELSKLKCVVSVEDGKYGVVFKSLDTDPLVGKFLEIGEQLEICNLSKDGSGLTKVNSYVGGTATEVLPKFQALDVGDKINVMVVFDENAILYKRDIIIQDGIHGHEIELDDTDATWTLEDGSAAPTAIPYQYFKISEPVPANTAGGSVLVTITNALNESEEIVLKATPTDSTMEIKSLQVNGDDVDPTETYSEKVTLTLTVAAPAVETVSILDKDKAAILADPLDISKNTYGTSGYQLNSAVTPSAAVQTVTWAKTSGSDHISIGTDGKLAFTNDVAAGDTAVITCTSTDDTSKSATLNINIVA